MIFSLNDKYEKDAGRFTLEELNETVPLIVINTSYFLDTFKGKRVYSYPSTDTSKFRLHTNTIKKILNSFQHSIKFDEYHINHKKYYICKGMIVDENFNILVLVSLKKEAISDYVLHPPISYNNYIVYYSSLFYTDSSFTTLGRRFQKEIINPCLLKGMEVRVLTPEIIEKNTFARLFELKYDSITQLDNFLKNKLKNVFTEEGGETFDLKQKLIQVEENYTELSIEEEALLFDLGSLEDIEIGDTSITTPIVPGIILIDDTE